ncbi:ankyrin repeat-containing domain protein [Lasiosphaeria hispida]|uniref:Ankyrin repeat-containing domain protein n=1 Tax=Lasiosphaeria hispida TaxID=260671 RepID=A0AAJ0HFG2_9PEZI|nr:ankyrin repeat-containing domain protein [Lasiosphaeria hispida]
MPPSFMGMLKPTLLLKQGADISSRATTGFGILVTKSSGRREIVHMHRPIPLQIAASRGHFEVVNLLLGHGADLMAKAGDWYTAFKCAVEFYQDSVGTQLLEIGATCGVRIERWSSVLYHSVIYEHEGYVRQILAKGIDMKLKSYEYHHYSSPLLLAVRKENKVIVRLLLDAGDDFQMALMYAIAEGYKDMVCFLLDECNGRTAGYSLNVRLPAFEDRGESRFMPLEHGNPNAFLSGWRRETPLEIACERSHSEIVCCLLDRGADIKDYLLLVAASEGYRRTVEVLVERGVNIEVRGASGHGPTALWEAAKAGHRGVTEALLVKGADTEARNIDGIRSTALWEAAKAGHKGVVEALLEGGADIELRTSHFFFREIKSTALFEAVKAGHTHVVGRLLKRGAKIPFRSEFYPHHEKTALSAAMASSKFGVNMLELLLDSGANINERGGSDGETALLVAVRRGDRATVRFLLARGVDVEARDWAFRTPLSLAAQSLDERIVEMLLDYGATANSLEWWEIEWLRNTFGSGRLVWSVV